MMGYDIIKPETGAPRPGYPTRTGKKHQYPDERMIYRMYNRLLLEQHGGIVSKNQMDEQANGATIAIGLGGTGIDCLRVLKRHIYSRLQPDDPNAEIPAYSHIKFLAVDSDRGSLRPDGQNWDLDINSEFFEISSGDINGLLAQTKVLSDMPQFRWLKNTEEDQMGLSILSAEAGAGGVRQIGRLLIIEKSVEFVHKLEQLISTAKEGLPEGSDVSIHIFAGLGGGTGSGTCLDVCYLTQEALAHVGESGHAQTFGYFFLPDVNLSKPEIMGKPQIASYIKVNGFAAMKELDYCMNFENNNDTWHQQYTTFKIGPTKNPPVKLAHLISATTVNGAVTQNGYVYAMNVVSNYIMQFVVKSNGFTMKSHLSNFERAVGQVSKMHGANYKYCILGAANATVPMREITTYLSSRLFESMGTSFNALPTENAVKAMAADLGLETAQLQRALLDKTSYQAPKLELDWKSFTDMSEQDEGGNDLILDARIEGAYRIIEQKVAERVEVNKQALLRLWKPEEVGYDNRDSISKMSKAYYHLREVVGDAARGPAYAASMLMGAHCPNLVGYLRGVRKQVQEAYRQNEPDMLLRIQSVKSARRAFLHKGLFASGKDRFEQFLRAMQQYKTLKLQLKVLEEMEKMMTTMIEQFEKLYTDYFFPYAQVAQKLSDTFHENYQYLTNPKKQPDDPFTIPLITIRDRPRIKGIQEILDKAVEDMSLAEEVRSFHEKLFTDYYVWRNDEEDKVSKFVSDYLIDRFSGFTSRTLTNYLEMRFNTTDPARLTKMIETEILLDLSKKANPLFWQATTSGVSGCPMGYCSVPSGASVITTAAQSMVSNQTDLQMIPNFMPDRISILRCWCGVPMYSYNGVSTYFNPYIQDRSVGKHIYELSKRDPRNWVQVPNLRPYSTINDPSQKLLTASENYDLAVKLGIIGPNPQSPEDYRIFLYADDPELEMKVVSALTAGRTEKENALQLLQWHLDNRKYERTIVISNDGASGHEEKVRKDHVVEADMTMELVCRQIALEQKWRDLMKKLHSAISDEEVRMKLRKEYFNAMMTGVLHYQFPAVKYLKPLFGDRFHEIPLSDPTVQPYGMAAPLYQAFLAYCEMDEEIREGIVRASNLRLQTLDPSLKTACENLTNAFAPARFGAQLDMLRDQVRDQNVCREIENFLIEFNKSLNSFTILYGLS